MTICVLDWNDIVGGVHMRWSLSEFLNLVELRSQTWCFADLGTAAGFAVPHNEEIYFYAVLEGAASIAGVADGSVDLRSGDIVMVLSGEAHALRNRKKCRADNLEFLTSGEYADTPPTIRIGEGNCATRVLAGRLKIRWPGGHHPRSIAAVLRVQADDNVVNFQRLLQTASESGATSMLTRAATLLFVSAFREHPDCRAAFFEFGQNDPVSRARQYMEMHPFHRWTVEILAHKVGMGRSNFATRFSTESGRTPMEFLSEERMKHAALFLEKTDMKIAEIGARVGYRSEAAFIRRFSAQYGVTPGELRKRSRRNVPRNFDLSVGIECSPAIA
jgi:AraC-like DNA-binding protein/mannose-6-phosphate isomerase-like protein (cupin superfamily)